MKSLSNQSVGTECRCRSRRAGQHGKACCCRRRGPKSGGTECQAASETAELIEGSVQKRKTELKLPVKQRHLWKPSTVEYPKSLTWLKKLLLHPTNRLKELVKSTKGLTKSIRSFNKTRRQPKKVLHRLRNSPARQQNY